MVPRSSSSAGPEAVELAASAGLFLDPWQQDAVVDLLGEDETGRWAATTGGLIVPRQNGKGSVIEALELAWLFLCDVELIFHSAHLFATSADAYRRIKGLIQQTPDLDRQVRKFSDSHGQEGVELRSGARLRFVTRSKSGGRGFPAPVVVMDEAFNASQQAMAALVPTMAAQDNPFLLLTSSAPIDDPCSDVLRQFMKRSRTGEVDRRCYIEYAADRDAPLEEQLRQANPGYGIRLNDDVIAEERELLSPEDFDAERLGIVDLDTETHRVIDALLWSSPPPEGCLDAKAAYAGAIRTAVDVSPDGRSSAIGQSDGTLVVVTKHQDGTGWVVPMLVDKGIREVWLDAAGPAGQLVEPLEAAGITVHRVTFEQGKAAAAQFLTAVNDKLLRHIGQAELDRAAANADKREVGDGGFLWSRRKSTVDICPLVAVTWAKWAAGASKPVPTPGFVDLDEFDDD